MTIFAVSIVKADIITVGVISSPIGDAPVVPPVESSAGIWNTNGVWN